MNERLYQTYRWLDALDNGRTPEDRTRAILGLLDYVVSPEALLMTLEVTGQREHNMNEYRLWRDKKPHWPESAALLERLVQWVTYYEENDSE